MKESGLIPEIRMENTKEIINCYKEFENINENREKEEEEEIEEVKEEVKKEERVQKYNQNNENNNEINIIYNNIRNENSIHIFGKKFVENNKDKCKIEFENKEYELKEYFNIKDYTNNKLNKIEMKLKYIKNITNMSYMFCDCTSLISLPDISKWNTNNITGVNSMFNYCTSLLSLPDISKWNTNNVTDMSYMF